MSSEEISTASLAELSRAEAACRRCPLYRNATQVVPGEGQPHSILMLVGEQPGDKEDVAGKPFVGPAGKLLDKILEDAGIPRSAVFVTNAVKHFKFEPRGKRRLHRRPNAGEIERCRWWLDQERKLVAPKALVAMGATAIRSLTGCSKSVSSLRGRTLQLPDGAPLLATIHPSHLLRLRDPDDQARERLGLQRDLTRGWELARRLSQA